MKFQKFTALLLGLALLASCSSKTPAPTPDAVPTPEASAEPFETVERPAVRVSMLKGPTGLGSARLMEDNKGGTTVNDYTFTVLAEPTEAVAKLTGGEVDIAALPTNLASTLYHKTDGNIQLLALNTYGVLYILEKGDTVHSLADLAGKTVHAYGQGANPEFVLDHLLEKQGLTAGEDVAVQWYSSTDEVTALMASGEADVCMLPVPAATAVLMQNSDVRSAVDLTQEWENAEADGVLTMGCVVVRTAFAQENPEAVKIFLREYEDSIDYMSDSANLDTAAALAETYGIVPKAAVAKRAIPDANLCFVTGDDMMAGIQGYYEVLFQADPASIGGSIPDGAFYYGRGV